jgi:hypothetical protein
MDGETITALIIVAVGIVFLFSKAKQHQKLYCESVCSSCGAVSVPKRGNKGSFGVELVLWLFFIVPGLIYSLWRQANEERRCRACNGTSMVPLDSPRGQKLYKQYQ